MIQPLLDAIVAKMFQKNPLFEKGVSLARIDSKGRILIQTDPEKNEFQWGGITDQSQNYFYIRHRNSGEIFHEPAPGKQFVSCNGPGKTVSRYEFRVVSCMTNFCPYKLEKIIRDSLVMADFQNTTTVSKINATPIRSQIDSMAVVEEENPEPKQFDKNLIFVAVDFDLSMEITYF